MRLMYVDPIGGVAGDMLVAALIDAGAPLSDIQEAVDAVLPGRFSLRSERVTRAGLGAALLRIESPENRPLARRSHGELASAIDGAVLDETVKIRAGNTLGRLTRAEWLAHGPTPYPVRDEGGWEVFHEIGDDDTLLDIVGFSAAFTALGLERMYVGPLPLGGAGTMLPPSSSGHGPGSS